MCNKTKSKLNKRASRATAFTGCVWTEAGRESEGPRPFNGTAPGPGAAQQLRTPPARPNTDKDHRTASGVAGLSKRYNLSSFVDRNSMLVSQRNSGCVV